MAYLVAGPEGAHHGGSCHTCKQRDCPSCTPSEGCIPTCWTTTCSSSVQGGCVHSTGLNPRQGGGEQSSGVHGRVCTSEQVGKVFHTRLNKGQLAALGLSLVILWTLEGVKSEI